MLAVAFVRWWYGAGWKQLARNNKRRLHRTMLSFSAPTLARTLFAPWKRIVTTPGAGIEAHIRAAGDNAISRLVGFFVRLIVLMTAGIVIGGLSVASLFQMIIWPLLPPLVLVCLVKGMP